MKKKKYILTNLNFNEICFLQQSVRVRLEYYKTDYNGHSDIKIKAIKDLTNLLKKIDILKGNTKQKIDVGVIFKKFNELKGKICN